MRSESPYLENLLLHTKIQRKIERIFDGFDYIDQGRNGYRVIELMIAKIIYYFNITAVRGKLLRWVDWSRFVQLKIDEPFMRIWG